MKFKLDLFGNKCNDYPHLTILHNQKTVFTGRIMDHATVELDIDLQDSNTIRLEGIKKSTGENNKWNTTVGPDGTIIEDMYLLINNVWIDGIAMNLEWIRLLLIHTSNKPPSQCNAGIWENGYIEFNIQLPLLGWIIQEKFIKIENNASASMDACSGESKFAYDYVQQKINLINQLLND